MPCSQVQLARVVVCVLVLVDVVCVMIVVLIAHVDVVHAVDTVFVAIFCSGRCTLYTNLVRVNPHKLPTRKKSPGKIDDLNNVDFISSNVHSSQDDHKGKKPDNKTCFQNPQSCS